MRSRFSLAGLAQPFRFQQVSDAPNDLHCLTEAVYFEARGETAAGQQAVAQVVLNRVRHPAFPKTVCAVVHQRTASGCQFSFACSSRQSPIESAAWRRAEAIASGEMHGAVMAVVGDATQFQAARSNPFTGLLKVAQIGAHIFYRLGSRAGAPAMFHQTPLSSGSAAVQIAQLEPSPAITQVQGPADGRIRVTLYPTPANTAPAAAVLSAAKPEAVVLKLPAVAPVEVKPEPVAATRNTLAPAATLAAKAPEAPSAKPAVLSLALAQF